MSDREAALEQIAALAREHALTPRDIAAHLERDEISESRRRGLLGRILGYLGGTFLFAGIGVLIALNWALMNAPARIIVTLGTGLAAFVMALAAARDTRYERAATPLFLIAAALQPTGMLVALNEVSTGGDWRYAVLVTTIVMVLQQSTIFFRTRRNTLLFTSIAFALWAFGTGLDLLGADWEWIALVLGASTIGLCVGLERTPHHEVTPSWYLLGATGFYVGLFETVDDSAIDLLFLLAGLGGLFLSAHVRRRALLVASTIAILAFVSYYTSRHFLDSLGWPLLLIVLGVILLLLSALALRIDRRYLTRSA